MLVACLSGNYIDWLPVTACNYEYMVRILLPYYELQLSNARAFRADVCPLPHDVFCHYLKYHLHIPDNAKQVRF